jgi:hypothetical protein
VCSWIFGTAAVERSSAPARSKASRTPTSGSALSPTVGTGSIARNCAGRSPLSAPTWRRIIAPLEHALLRLDGQYGTGAVLAELAGYAFVTRGKDYTVLDQPEIQTRLHLPADGQFSREDKHPGTNPLRLPRGGCGTTAGTLPCCGGNPSGRPDEEPRWPHT